ncbi:unnamed protein product [Schistocephalus solidus]|uniref:Uncharacterized protein n=1 Tax=Schistocephalus solidus TaxID=70667 RepID=A0A183SRQ8_SCHSO|nr:unnamed protein product [Schistocephalus solidus]
MARQDPGHGSPGADRNPQHPRHAVASATAMVRMDDKRLPKRLFYGDAATGIRRQGVRKRHYKETLKKSLKQLQINPSTWEDLTQDRPSWRRSVKTGSAIYGVNSFTAAKAKRAARKSQAPQIKTTNVQALPACPR